MGQDDNNTSSSSELGEGDMVIVSADRTPQERKDAYEVEWREPANSISFTDRIRRLF